MSSHNKFVEYSTAFTKLPYCEFADELVQSPNDHRKHKLIKLPNNMIVLCTSDPDASKAAASLSVNVGSFVDPPEFQGLAHFLEHAIHLGSTKYPGANEYQTFIQSNQGYMNAETCKERTGYHFTISPNAFAEALDRFAQLFISPLFDRDRVEKELQVIESESKGNIQDPLEQEYSAFCSLLDPDHPASRYSCGNLETLDKLNVYEEVISLFKKYYSADIMKLAIVSNHSMDNLVEWAVAKFSSVKSLGDTRPDPLPSPYNGLLGKLIHYQTPNNANKLSMYFPTPEINSLYKVNIEHYFECLMKLKHAGSLLNYLTKHNLATKLDIHTKKRNGYSLTILSFVLTDKLEYPHVVNATLAYISMLRSSSHEKFYNEVKVAKEISKCSIKTSERNWVLNMSHNSHNRFVDYKYYMAKEHMCVYDGPAITGFMNNLDGFFLTLNTPKNTVKYTHQSKHFDVPYSMTSFDAQQITIEHFKLPPPNKYIPESPAVLNGVSAKYPQLLEKADTYELWFKGVYSSLYGAIMLEICLPNQNNVIWKAREEVMKHYIENMLEDIINQGELAGIRTYVSYAGDSIYIETHGASEKLLLITTDIIERLRKPGEGFERSKQMARAFLSQKLSPIAQLRSDVYPHIAVMDMPLDRDLLDSLDKVDPNIQVDISHCYIKVLVIGNFTEYQARAIKINAKAMAPGQRIVSPRLNISPGHYMHVSQNCDSTSANNAVLVTIHCAVYNDTKQKMALELIGGMLQSYLYEELRIKQQLGYHLLVFVLKYVSLRVVRIEIQSEHCPIVLTQRIDSALANFKDHIGNVSVDEMTKSAASVKKFNPVMQEGAHLWEKIYSGSYEFDVREKEAAALQSITKGYLVEVWDRYFSPKTYTRVDLQSWVNPPSVDELRKKLSSPDAHPDHLQTPDGRIIIDDVKQFQATQKVFGLPLMATTAIPIY